MRKALRVLELTYRGFRAVWREARQAREAAITPQIVERLATLGTSFSQNVLADEAAWLLELDGES